MKRQIIVIYKIIRINNILMKYFKIWKSMDKMIRIKILQFVRKYYCMEIIYIFKIVIYVALKMIMIMKTKIYMKTNLIIKIHLTSMKEIWNIFNNYQIVNVAKGFIGTVEVKFAKYSVNAIVSSNIDKKNLWKCNRRNYEQII